MTNQSTQTTECTCNHAERQAEHQGQPGQAGHTIPHSETCPIRIARDAETARCDQARAPRSLTELAALPRTRAVAHEMGRRVELAFSAARELARSRQASPIPEGEWPSDAELGEAIDAAEHLGTFDELDRRAELSISDALLAEAGCPDVTLALRCQVLHGRSPGDRYCWVCRENDRQDAQDAYDVSQGHSI